MRGRLVAPLLRACPDDNREGVTRAVPQIFLMI